MLVFDHVCRHAQLDWPARLVLADPPGVRLENAVQFLVRRNLLAPQQAAIDEIALMPSMSEIIRYRLDYVRLAKSLRRQQLKGCVRALDQILAALQVFDHL